MWLTTTHLMQRQRRNGLLLPLKNDPPGLNAYQAPSPFDHEARQCLISLWFKGSVIGKSTKSLVVGPEVLVQRPNRLYRFPG